MKKIMELLQNMKAKNEKKDNKGFSLVELIIVIAIMAILVGIVGTQVIPYISKSKVAKDQQVLNSISTAGVAAYSENGLTGDITVDVFQNPAYGADTAEGKVQAAILAASGFKDLAAFQSALESDGTIKSVEFKVTAASHQAITKVSYDGKEPTYKIKDVKATL